ncbi:MAG: class I SAM-dependent methyltransferase [Acidobacteria bacterium]|nr:class I SAM-dependent methyltransferase [Acidobacteriota bacterium]
MTGDWLVGTATRAAERGWVSDRAIRAGIRALCAQRLRAETRRHGTTGVLMERAFIDWLRGCDVAPVPAKANEQHYELPAAFFELMLGPQLKYSSCWWNAPVASLGDAEEDALAETARRAGIGDGMRVLDLGCGWGSLSLWMARRHPGSEIVAVSNSAAQRRFIEERAAALGLRNLMVVTADMNTFAPGGTFDRVVSVEMFEHMRNYHVLLDRVASWLTPGGRLFVHVFCHRSYSYVFEDGGAHNWMGRHFFTGGLMPSATLLPSIPSRLTLEAQWMWDGRHYERTANAWLARLDAARDDALTILATAYGTDMAAIWLQRWRIFLMACAELFGYDDGAEWGVVHHRFTRTT